MLFYKIVPQFKQTRPKRTHSLLAKLLFDPKRLTIPTNGTGYWECLSFYYCASAMLYAILFGNRQQNQHAESRFHYIESHYVFHAGNSHFKWNYSFHPFPAFLPDNSLQFFFSHFICGIVVFPCVSHLNIFNRIVRLTFMLIILPNRLYVRRTFHLNCKVSLRANRFCVVSSLCILNCYFAILQIFHTAIAFFHPKISHTRRGGVAAAVVNGAGSDGTNTQRYWIQKTSKRMVFPISRWFRLYYEKDWNYFFGFSTKTNKRRLLLLAHGIFRYGFQWQCCIAILRFKGVQGFDFHLCQFYFYCAIRGTCVCVEVQCSNHRTNFKAKFPKCQTLLTLTS